MKAFRNNEGRHKMRLSLARQFDEIERLSIGLGGGKSGGSTLLEGRNGKAIEVLQQQLALGKKSLAIYYGAAHMPDLERRLLALGFKKEGERWLVAWDVTKRPDK